MLVTAFAVILVTVVAQDATLGWVIALVGSVCGGDGNPAPVRLNRPGFLGGSNS